MAYITRKSLLASGILAGVALAATAGFVWSGMYNIGADDTHTRPVPPGVLTLLEELSARVELPGVMLERDDDFPTEDEFNAEMGAIAAAVQRGARSREARYV